MGSEEFAQATRGGGTTALSQVPSTGAIEIDNYREGGSFSGSPPADVDPTETIQEVGITTSGSDSTITVTTSSGTSWTINLNGTTLVLSTVEIDSLSFGGASEIEGWWVGE